MSRASLRGKPYTGQENRGGMSPALFNPHQPLKGMIGAFWAADFGQTVT
jgi:hypothetical protein